MDDLNLMEKPVMKSTLLSLLLLLTVSQLAHGATQGASLSSITVKPSLDQTFDNTNQKKDKDDEDNAPIVPTY
jgi:hypothetical protein